MSIKMVRLLVLLALGIWLAGADDPRPELIELQLSGELDRALQEVAILLGKNETATRKQALRYLEGHLLDRLSRESEAVEAFSTVLTTTPLLADHARYRLAVDSLRSNDPRQAAVLLAALLDNDPPSNLRREAVALLNRAVAASGDCRPLSSWQEWDLDSRDARRLTASRVDCESPNPLSSQAVDWLIGILERQRNDETARRAAHKLAREGPRTLELRQATLVGMTLFGHREFDRALPFLSAAVADPVQAARGLDDIDADDIRYALARTLFWQGDYPLAIEQFTAVATHTHDGDRSARALFQRGRAFALLGDWDAAVESYDAAVAARPTSSWAGAATLSAMRLAWRQGREVVALEYFDRLRSNGRWRSSAGRAALFLAVTDVVRLRSDRAEQWLDIADRASRRVKAETTYWRGRLAELEQRPADAVQRYALLLSNWPYHPLSAAARSRLRRPVLQHQAELETTRWAQSSRDQDLLKAIQFLGDGPERRTIESKLLTRWRRGRQIRPLLGEHSLGVDDWPLWQRDPRDADELLLTVGIAELYSTALRRAFPISDTDLAVSASRLLSASGLYRRALYYAEVIEQRVPESLPHALLTNDFRRLLFPRAWDFTLEQQARRFGVDPDLLRAIIREESRFDPQAISSASARGLTQFVLPTARRLGAKIGLGDLDAWNLHEPEIAITLGAAYLAELDRHFDGHTLRMVAAYNAGEAMARLWKSYCFSDEPEEYFSAVGFRQTRNYLEKVLSSRDQYREIYTDAMPDYPAPDLATSSTGGNAS